MKCKTCRFCEKPIITTICRRNPPVAGSTTVMARWPVVDPENDWCGEYAPVGKAAK